MTRLDLCIQSATSVDLTLENVIPLITSHLCLMTKRTFVLPVYVIRCVFYSRSCLFLFLLKSLTLSIKILNYFDTVTLYTK